MRRRPWAAVGCLAAIGLLSGCIYDAAPLEVVYENRLDVAVIVSLEGPQGPYELTVAGNSFGSLGTDECKGTAIVVETEDGDLIGRVEKPACPDWVLVVNEDGTVDYAEG